MIIERSFEQLSKPWFLAKLGNIGATGIQKIITNTGKRSKSDFIYEMAEIIRFREKFVKEIEDGVAGFKSDSMDRGNEMEPKARGLFQLITKLEVETVAMCYPDELKRWHISPDGLIVGKPKGLEIKAPETKTHIKYLDENKLPLKYFMQVHGSMACTGYESWYFMSFHPELPPLILEIQRDEELCQKIIQAVESFLFDLGVLVKKLAA